MPGNRANIAILAGALIALGWLLVAVLDPDPPGKTREYVVIGMVVGTIFGQTALAGAWTALGPGALLRRLSLSLVWIGMLPLALAVNIRFHGGPPAEFLVVMAACLYGQWLLVQAPLWGLAIFAGLHLRHADDVAPAGPANRQFGIRQLMVFTFIVAVVLAIARLIISHLGTGFRSNDALIWAFLAAVAVATTLPLLLAALLERRALFALLLALALLAVCTFWEGPLLNSMSPGGGGPDVWHFVWINSCSAAWILAIAGILRLGGYRLSGQESRMR